MTSSDQLKMRLKQVQLGIKKITLAGIGSLEKNRLKDHRQRIPKKCYKTIFRKINAKEIFSNLHSLQMDYFS